MPSVIKSVTLKVLYTDSSGNKREVELSNDGLSLNGTELRLLPCEYDGNPATTFPVLASASHISKPVDQRVLRVTDPDKRTERVPISLTGTPTYSSIIYQYSPGTLKVGTYTCKKLNYIKCLTITSVANDTYTQNWVRNVPTGAGKGTFVKNSGNSTWPTNVHGIPGGWKVETETS